jgi:hypothetical protein
MRLLRFATPPNASNLSLGIGFAGSQIITTDKGFGSTATVPPGTTEFAFGIDIPYTETATELSYKAVYPTARVVVLVPPDMFVNGKDFQAQGMIDSLGSRYQLYTVASAAAGKQISLELSGLPKAGETSNLSASALTILAAILALLALLALVLYLWRGDRLAAALGLVPRQTQVNSSRAPASTLASTGVSKDVGASERDQLLRELLALERGHTTGVVSDEDFRKHNRALRLRLREVLASEQAASPVAQGAHTSAEAALTPDAEAGLYNAATPQETAPEQSSGGHR